MFRACAALACRAAAQPPRGRGDIARAVLNGRDHGLQFTPYQLVKIFEELTRGTREGAFDHGAWDDSCDAALLWLCEGIAAPDFAAHATADDCAALLKRISIVHTKIPPALKQSIIEAIVQRVKQPRIHAKLTTRTGLDVLTSLARAHVKERGLCVAVLHQILPGLAEAAAAAAAVVAGDTGRDATTPGRDDSRDPRGSEGDVDNMGAGGGLGDVLRGVGGGGGRAPARGQGSGTPENDLLTRALCGLHADDLANLMYALPRHVLSSGHPTVAALRDPMTAAILGRGIRREFTSSIITRVVGGAAGVELGDAAMEEVCRVYSAELLRPEVAQRLTEWEARQLGGVFERYSAMPPGGDVDALIRRALARERPGGDAAHHADLVYGMARDWIAVAEAVPVPARVACRELRLLAQRATFRGDRTPADEEEIDGLLAAVSEPAVLQTLRGEELYYLLHAMSRLRRTEHALLQKLGDRLVDDEVLKALVHAQHIVGVMTSVAALSPGKWGDLGLTIVSRYAEKLLAPSVQFSRVEYQHVGAMWSMALARASQGAMFNVLQSAVRKGDAEEYSARLLTPMLWSAAKVRLQKCEEITKMAARFEDPEIRGQLSLNMLGLALYSVAKLSLPIQPLLAEAALQDLPEKANPKVISMSLYAVQITGTLYPPVLDRLCARLVADRAVSDHFVKRPARPTELLRVFMAMKYTNPEYLTWVRRHVVARAAAKDVPHTFDNQKRRPQRQRHAQHMPRRDHAPPAMDTPSKC